MPFRSKKQQRFMYATKPKGVDLKEWADETDFSKLPEKARKKKKKDKNDLLTELIGEDSNDVFQGEDGLESHGLPEETLRLASIFASEVKRAQLGFGQSAMTSSYMKQLAGEILSVLNRSDAPTVNEISWMKQPVIRDALTRITRSESISDIRSDALFLLSAAPYWNFISGAGYGSKLRDLLNQAP